MLKAGHLVFIIRNARQETLGTPVLAAVFTQCLLDSLGSKIIPLAACKRIHKFRGLVYEGPAPTNGSVIVLLVMDSRR
jgi:hypothetical protein